MSTTPTPMPDVQPVAPASAPVNPEPQVAAAPSAPVTLGQMFSPAMVNAPAPTPAPAPQPAAAPTELPAAEPAAPAEPEQPADEVTQTHEQIMADLRRQHPEATDTVIKRLADAQAFIAEMKAKTAAQSTQITELLARVTKKEPPPAPQLSTAERIALGLPVESPQQPAAPQQAAATVAPAAPVQEQPAPAAQPLPEYLATPEAAYTEIATAMANGDFGRAAQVEGEVFSLRLSQMEPQIRAMIQAEAQRIVAEQTGDVLPAVRRTIEQRLADEDRSIAIGALEKSGVQVRTLFEPASDQILTIDGRQYPDTPANRIVQQNPWIMAITVQHPDPRIARQQTVANRYRAIASIAATQQPGQSAPAGQPAVAADQAAPGTAPVDAAALIEAGRQQAQREEQNRFRQAMNGGTLPPAPPSGEDAQQFGGIFGGKPNSQLSSMFRPVR